MIDLSRFANGSGDTLQVLGANPGRSTLTGRVLGGGRRPGTGATTLTAITGLGRFGTVRVLMRTPLFYVAQFPYADGRQFAPPAVNQVLSVPQGPRVRARRPR